MKSPEEIASLSREDLLALVAEQQRQIGQLTTTIERLRAEITRLQRGAKRQAAPFSKGSRVANPKRPGRKPGSGPSPFAKRPDPRRSRSRQ